MTARACTFSSPADDHGKIPSVNMPFGDFGTVSTVIVSDVVQASIIKGKHQYLMIIEA
jgi:hypothetical protein